MKRPHVAILHGGWSAEREVSLRSGEACAKALEGRPYRPTLIDVDRDIAQRLSELKPDVALNMLHGPFGEDGCIQGVLEILKIPYTHSGVLASALAMNKARARDVFHVANVPTAEGQVISRSTIVQSTPMEPPFVIKPISNGSSVGVFIVRTPDELPMKELTSPDWQFGDELLLERYVPGKELTCAVMGEKALDVIEIVSEHSFYDFSAKYGAGGSIHILPAKIPPEIYRKVQELALRAHRALGCRGISRSDFRFDENSGTLVCLEVNTQPGMTATSLVPDLAAYAGITFAQLVEWMIEDASVDR